METETTEPKPSMIVEPQQEHRWLQKLVGEWTIEGEASMGPGHMAEKFSSTESVHSINGIWIVAEGNIVSQDGTSSTILTVGYDTQKNKIVGTFIVSIATTLWVYEGELDQSNNRLTLNTEGPDMTAEAKTAKFQEVIEFTSEDHRTWTSYIQVEDGSWQQVMRMDYRRVH